MVTKRKLLVYLFDFENNDFSLGFWAQSLVDTLNKENIITHTRSTKSVNSRNIIY